MLKKLFLILSFIIIGFIGTSQGLGFLDYVKQVFSSHDLTPDSKSNPGPPLNLCLDIKCTPGSGGVFGHVPEVNEFINIFLVATYKSDCLRNAFNLSGASPEKNAEFVKQYTDQVLCEVGVDPQSAAAIGIFASAAIPQLDSLTLSVVSKAYANMAANFFYATGTLRKKNAKELALFFFKTMEDCAKDINENDDPKAKFLALANGFVSGFDKKGLFTSTKAPILGVYVGNQWLLAAADPCTNKRFI